MQRGFQIIGLATFLLGLHLLLSNLYQPRLLSTEVINSKTICVLPSAYCVKGATISEYLLPDLAERLPDIAFSFGVLLIGVLGIYTDIYRLHQEESSSQPS